MDTFEGGTKIKPKTTKPPIKIFLSSPIHRPNIARVFLPHPTKVLGKLLPSSVSHSITTNSFVLLNTSLEPLSTNRVQHLDLSHLPTEKRLTISSYLTQSSPALFPSRLSVHPMCLALMVHM